MAQMIDRTAGEMLAALTDTVAERGAEFVYHRRYGPDTESCEYVVMGEPACIAGAVLARLGINVHRLPNCTVRTLVDTGDLSFTDGGALDVLAIAQSAQDARYSWGDSLAIAMGAHHGMFPEAVGARDRRESIADAFGLTKWTPTHDEVTA